MNCNNIKIFQELENIDEKKQNKVMTVIEGEGLGEKALISDHRLVCESCVNGFFSKNEQEALSIEKNGIVTIGGRAVFSEILGHEKKLVICGGGHVSMPIITVGLMLGFSVTVLEDRPKFADNARRQGASEVICDAFDEGLKKIQGDEDTYFVIVTRGHRYDQLCLEHIVRKKHAYIGMMGSRRRVAIVKKTVLEGGADPEVMEHVYSPIGLDIGAETPEEIAVAILAEIIEVKNKKTRNSGYSKELLQNILYEKSTGERSESAKVLATIITRKGSAPREVGTKMLILPDGRTVGTIGGGCVESEIMQKGLLMIRSGEDQAKICHVDMTADDAAEEGMVCGGIIDVLLEIV